MEYVYKEFNGKTTIIDKYDEWVFDGAYHWYAQKSYKNSYYIVGYKQHDWNHSIALARLIMGNPENMYVDHKNHNTLDNRKENLRICTNAQNNWNQKKSETKLQYKGIHYDPRSKAIKHPFQARIRFNNKLLLIGSFATDVEAALAYDKKALELFGEFACINFPNGVTQ